MAELPGQLPRLRQGLVYAIDELAKWLARARQHPHTVDLQSPIRLLLACHRAALGCADGDAVQARQAADEAARLWRRWSAAPSALCDPRNSVDDQQAELDADVFTGVLDGVTSIVEDILDWQFGVASARVRQFGIGGGHEGEPTEFHAEDAILLCQMQALCACCEAALTVLLDQPGPAQHKIAVAQGEIAAWRALVVHGTQQY